MTKCITQSGGLFLYFFFVLGVFAEDSAENHVPDQLISVQNSRVEDRIDDMWPDAQGLTVLPQTNQEHEKSDGHAEVWFQINISKTTDNREEDYRADWIVDVVKNSDSYRVIKTGLIHMVKVDPKTKKESVVVLPDWSPFDELRQAVRNEDEAEVETLDK